MTGLLKRPRLFEKYFPLRGDRDGPIQMRQRAVKIPGGAGDPGGENMRGGIFRPFGETGLDMAARRLNFTLGKQHGGQQMIEYGIAGLAGQTVLAELARLIAPAGIEGGGGTTNDVLGAVVAHGKHIRTKEWSRKEGAHLAPRAGRA